jgi:formylglycine-generating enzyme required for sulfatase activity/streptogramin lyase
MKRLFLLCLGTQALATNGASAGWKVENYLGDGNPGFKGDFKRLTEAQTEKPFGMVRGPDGALWFCEYGGNRVRRVGADGRVSTVVGTGVGGFAGDGDKASSAKLNRPHEIRFDAAGDLYIADMANHSIRKVDMKTRVIRTVAGTGFGGYFGDGDLATVAHLRQPSGIQFGPDGSLYICDTGNHSVRKLDTKTGVISNVAGTGKPGATPDGSAIAGTPITSPRAIDFDRQGNPWVVLRDSNLVVKLDLASGTIKHVAGNGEKGSGGDGGPAKKASLNSPKGISIDREGNAWVVDGGNYSIRKVAVDGTIDRVAGTGDREDGPNGDALASQFKMPQGIFADKDGSVFVGDSEAHRIRVLRPEGKASESQALAAQSKSVAPRGVSEGKTELLARNASGGELLSRVSPAPEAGAGSPLSSPAPKADAAPVAVTAVAAAGKPQVAELAKTETVAVPKKDAGPGSPAAPQSPPPGNVPADTKPPRAVTPFTEEPELAAKRVLEEARLKFEAEKEAAFKKREEALVQKASEIERREHALQKKQQELSQLSDTLRVKEVQIKEADLSRREQDLRRRMAEIEAAKAARGTAAGRPPSVPPQPDAVPAPLASPAPQPGQAPQKETLSAAEASPVRGADRPPGVPLENTLGMKFVPVGDVFFATTETRVRDYTQFVADTRHSKTRWQSPGFEQTPDDPVVMVSWVDAVSFCKWLTDRERAAGLLKPGEAYRLPTDLEWSKAVGLPAEKGATPEARDMGVQNHFPWGSQWPPLKGAGNYTGRESGAEKVIPGYDDGFAHTSPVGSFAPNRKGLFDLGGNVWEWCGDTWNSKDRSRVLRGGSWYQGSMQLGLLSSCRIPAAPDREAGFIGFRVVRSAASTGR